MRDQDFFIMNLPFYFRLVLLISVSRSRKRLAFFGSLTRIQFDYAVIILNTN